MNYYPQGGAADLRQLYRIIDTYLRPLGALAHALHVDFLLNLLQNDDENLWTNREFIIFVINHSFLMSLADNRPCRLLIKARQPAPALLIKR